MEYIIQFKVLYQYCRIVCDNFLSISNIKIISIFTDNCAQFMNYVINNYRKSVLLSFGLLLCPLTLPAITKHVAFLP